MKERHIKTFAEKYGNNDVYQEAVDIYTANFKKLDDEELFAILPRAGYLRIEITYGFGDWWYDANDEEWSNAKVLRVNEDEGTVEYAIIDSHNGGIGFMKRHYKGFAVKGNVLIKVNYDESQ